MLRLGTGGGEKGGGRRVGEKDDAGKKDGERRAVREQGATGILERRQGVHMALIKTHRQGWGDRAHGGGVSRPGVCAGGAGPALPGRPGAPARGAVRARGGVRGAARRGARPGPHDDGRAAARCARVATRSFWRWRSGCWRPRACCRRRPAGEPVPLSPTWAADLLGTGGALRGRGALRGGALPGAAARRAALGVTAGRATACWSRCWSRRSPLARRTWRWSARSTC